MSVDLDALAADMDSLADRLKRVRPDDTARHLRVRASFGRLGAAYDAHWWALSKQQSLAEWRGCDR